MKDYIEELFEIIKILSNKSKATKDNEEKEDAIKKVQLFIKQLQN